MYQGHLFTERAPMLASCTTFGYISQRVTRGVWRAGHRYLEYEFFASAAHSISAVLPARMEFRPMAG